MKRSEMISLIKKHMVEYQFHERTKAAELLLKELENNGMLPTLNTVTLIEDTARGGVKHSPTEHKWDEE